MNRDKHVVFVGGGHAHLYALARTNAYRRRGVAVTLVAPGPFWYSGMGPGLLSGRYSAADDTVDLRRMVENAGGRFIEGTVSAIRADDRQLLLAGGETLAYDALSLNVGSEVPALPGSGAGVFRVKPVENFLAFREALQGRTGTRPRVVIVGGGPAGCESAANTAALFRDRGQPADIHLVTGASRLLDDMPARAARLMQKVLAEQGIRVTTGRRVESLGDNTITLDNGRTTPCDLALLALGVRPPSLLSASPIVAADDGAMVVNEHLQSTSHPEVFGGGDCIRMAGRDLARVGVYAVRQGPVLYRNLLACLQGDRLTTFDPQPHYLLILNCGDGTGLLAWRGFVVRSRWAFRFKEYLDRKFIVTYQQAARASSSST